MKKILLIMLILCSVSIPWQASAQWDNGTSSNPTNPIPSNVVGTNIWDWTSTPEYGQIGSFTTGTNWFYNINPNHLAMKQNYTTGVLNGYPRGIESPYYSSYSTNYEVLNFLKNNNTSDYLWTDGWELITRNFGYTYTERDSDVATSDNSVPYFILYNKYSGVMRVFGVIPSDGGFANFSSITVQLSFLTNNDEGGTNPYYSNYQYSALLGMNGGAKGKAQALDMPTTVTNMAKTCPFIVFNNQFFFADFQTGYDPCTCWNNGGLQVRFFLDVSSTINLSGTFLGTNQSGADMISAGTDANGDPIGYLLAALNINGGNPSAGTLTYQNINTLVGQYNNVITANSNNVNIKIKNDLNIASKGLALASAFGGEEVGPVLDALAGLCSLVGTIIPSNEQTPPNATVIQGSMAFGGSATFPTPVNDAYIKFTIPGSQKVPLPPSTSYPEFYNTNVKIPNYPKYDEVLGPFALVETPKYNKSSFSSTSTDLAKNIIYPVQYYRDEYQMTDAIKYIFNPAVHPNMNATKVFAALELVYSGPTITDAEYSPGTFSVYGADWTYTSLPDQNNTSQIHYMTDWIDPTMLANRVIAVESNSQLPGTFSLHLKLYVNLVSNNLKKDNTPNQSLLLLTYPFAGLNSSSTNLTGFPTTIESDLLGGINRAAPRTLVLSSNNTGTTYAWDKITITGNLSTTSSTNSILEVFDGSIVMLPNSSLSPNMLLCVGLPTIYPPKPNPLASNLNLQTWCSGGANSNLVNSYKGNQLAGGIQGTRMAQVSDPGAADNLSVTNYLSVYPNPSSGNGMIKYSVASSGNVEIALYDLLGNKVKEFAQGYTPAGTYVNTFNGEQLESGIYILSMKSSGFTKTERLVIAK